MPAKGKLASQPARIARPCCARRGGASGTAAAGTSVVASLIARSRCARRARSDFEEVGKVHLRRGEAVLDHVVLGRAEVGQRGHEVVVGDAALGHRHRVQHHGGILSEERTRGLRGLLRMLGREVACGGQRRDQLLHGVGVRGDQVLARVQRAAHVVGPDVLGERQHLPQLAQLCLGSERLGHDEGGDAAVGQGLHHLRRRQLGEREVAVGVDALAGEQPAQEQVVGGEAAGNGHRLAAQVAHLGDVVRGQKHAAVAMPEQHDADGRAFLPQRQADGREREGRLQAARLERLRQLRPAGELHRLQGQLLEARARGGDDGEMVGDGQVAEADVHLVALGAHGEGRRRRARAGKAQQGPAGDRTGWRWRSGISRKLPPGFDAPANCGWMLGERTGCYTPASAASGDNNNSRRNGGSRSDAHRRETRSARF